jgi:peptidoglycan hydrolase-like protein with peptidoglycan-binding domain
MEALLPLLFKIVQLAPQVRGAIAAGTTALNAVNQAAPDLIPLLEQVGKTLFPDLSAANAQSAAGNMIFQYELIGSIQQDLNKLGATPPLDVDGEYGPLTKAAVTKFQSEHPPLEVDGWAGPETMKAIAAAITALPQ